MLSKNKIKYLSSLSEKKSRTESKAFLVEGEKMVLEALASEFQVKTLFYIEKMKENIPKNLSLSIEKMEISENEAIKISTQKTPQGIFAEVVIRDEFYSDIFSYKEKLTLAVHDIQDPGNLGTIVRTADWFGIKQILCSKATVDFLNPKVLQSTMGAVFRVKLIYTDLFETIRDLKQKHEHLPVFAAILGGTNIYKNNLPNNGILMMGNESKGLSDELIELATHKITIPRFGNTEKSSESLNVSVATAIILSELKRKTIEAP